MSIEVLQGPHTKFGRCYMSEGSMTSLKYLGLKVEQIVLHCIPYIVWGGSIIHWCEMLSKSYSKDCIYINKKNICSLCYMAIESTLNYFLLLLTSNGHMPFSSQNDFAQNFQWSICSRILHIKTIWEVFMFTSACNYTLNLISNLSTYIHTCITWEGRFEERNDILSTSFSSKFFSGTTKIEIGESKSSIFFNAMSLGRVTDVHMTHTVLISSSCIYSEKLLSGTYNIIHGYSNCTINFNWDTNQGPLHRGDLAEFKPQTTKTTSTKAVTTS